MTPTSDAPTRLFIRDGHAWSHGNDNDPQVVYSGARPPYVLRLMADGETLYLTDEEEACRIILRRDVEMIDVFTFVA